ncbi:MAG TPA: F0F1 ATP synthase subunit epsilon [Dehalococcoidia bacterium]|nr:F0F1 ATP synthase subunit epsilon [Dehalococcoidia bacterium]
MPGLQVDVVTAERVVFSGDVDSVVAPGINGELGILPRHAALVTALQAGEIRIRHGGQEEFLAVGGGFLEVRNNQVTILADTAERAEEIDLARAEEARRRAQERLAMRGTSAVDAARAEAALRRAMMRLKIGQRRRRGAARQHTE